MAKASHRGLPNMQVFRRLHAAYVDAVSNPFYTIGQPITSRRFNDGVKTAVELFAVSLA